MNARKRSPRQKDVAIAATAVVKRHASPVAVRAALSKAKTVWANQCMADVMHVTAPDLGAAPAVRVKGSSDILVLGVCSTT